MAEILTAGEILVEIMREEVGISLNTTDSFRGPFASGAPAIFIDTVAKLGHEAAIIGGVGDDEFGEICLKRLQEDGVDTEGIKISKMPTGVAFVAYFKDGSRKFIFHIRDSAGTEIGDLPDSKIRSSNIFHVMGCSLMIKEQLANRIIEYARKVKESGGLISFDPNIRVELMGQDYIKNAVESILELSSIIFPGLNELYYLTGTNDKDKAVKTMQNRIGTLVLKQGSKGCEIYSKTLEDPLIVPSFKIKQVDPTGAGDSFNAGFLSAYLEGKGFYDCGILANACGALNATRLGPMEGIFTRDKVEDFINNNSN